MPDEPSSPPPSDEVGIRVFFVHPMYHGTRPITHLSLRWSEVDQDWHDQHLKGSDNIFCELKGGSPAVYIRTKAGVEYIFPMHNVAGVQQTDSPVFLARKAAGTLARKAPPPRRRSSLGRPTGLFGDGPEL